MFDVGFQELVLIALIALLVFGPERLPGMVREVSLWLRKARALLNSAKTEIDQELQLLEMRQAFEEKRKKFEREMQAAGKESERLIIGDMTESETPKTNREPDGDDRT